jgi:DNA repair exonuclease SbcCD ATPase subunit
MQPLVLFIENFLCFDRSIINFSGFSSAVILGFVNNSDLYSNASGKSSIFRAIEYALFNETDYALDELVRDGTDKCVVSLTFKLDSNIYRIVRKRTSSKGSELSLYQLTDQEYDLENQDTPKSAWKDLSGRRSSDTEKEISRLIKLTFKSFRSTVHFAQQDMDGLATATPTDRKKILKEALDLAVYSKMEKFAKDKLNSLDKELSQKLAVIENIGNPQDDITVANLNCLSIAAEMGEYKTSLAKVEEDLLPLQEEHLRLNKEISGVEASYKAILGKKQAIDADIQRIQSGIERSKSQVATLKEGAKSRVSDLGAKNELLGVLTAKVQDTEPLKSQILALKETETASLSAARSISERIKEFLVPLPEGSRCKHCRSELTDEHRAKCQKEIDDDISKLQAELLEKQTAAKDAKTKVLALTTAIDEQIRLATTIARTKADISLIEKDLANNKEIFTNVKSSIKEQEELLSKKQLELISATQELAAADTATINSLRAKIEQVKAVYSQVSQQKRSIQEHLVSLERRQAILSNDIKRRGEDIIKRDNLLKEEVAIRKSMEMYPNIIQAFSHTGIPNLIISNILSELQSKANELLGKLKPGLQLSFELEKENSKGVVSDTLGINYTIHNKPRSYAGLSGAQKISVSFALKMGLSILLQNLMGASIQFILMDELDEALDKASIDTFIDIVRMLESEYKVLVITHNDRTKDKISDVIRVDQNLDGVSVARVV